MIGLVLVTHGRLAVEFRSALEHVVGPQRQIEAVTIGPDDDAEQARKQIVDAVKRVDSGQGVAILTDALLMRLTLVPALLTLLRDRSWAIPGWLERALPNVTIEAPGERESRGSPLGDAD